MKNEEDNYCDHLEYCDVCESPEKLIETERQAWLKEKQELEKTANIWYNEAQWWQDLAHTQGKAIEEFREEKKDLIKKIENIEHDEWVENNQERYYYRRGFDEVIEKVLNLIKKKVD